MKHMQKKRILQYDKGVSIIEIETCQFYKSIETK
jgi:hypothetical protein